MRDDERKIATKVIDSALGAGYLISLYDEDQLTIEKSRDRSTLLGELGSCDMQQIVLYESGTGKSLGAVDLVYGNEPGVLISDHSVRLTLFLKPIEEYAETFEE